MARMCNTFRHKDNTRLQSCTFDMLRVVGGEPSPHDVLIMNASHYEAQCDGDEGSKRLR